MAAPNVPTCYRHPGRETYIRCQRCERPICQECMVQASVGFQCPQCVHEGARATRAGLGAFGGRRSANPSLTTQALIAVNVAVWLAVVATGWRTSALVDKLSLLPRGRCTTDGGYYPNITSAATCNLGPNTEWHDGVSNGAFWQLLTSAFTHVEPWHILTNMLTLWFVGPALEAALGRTRFLLVYFVSALAGSTFVYWLAQEHSATLGASGAGFGMIGALLVIAHKVGGDTRFVLQWLGLNVLFTVVLWQYVSWQGHLGGLIGGLASTAVILYAPRQNRTQLQSVGIGALVLVMAIAVVARTTALA